MVHSNGNFCVFPVFYKTLIYIYFLSELCVFYTFIFFDPTIRSALSCEVSLNFEKPQIDQIQVQRSTTPPPATSLQRPNRVPTFISHLSQIAAGRRCSSKHLLRLPYASTGKRKKKRTGELSPLPESKPPRPWRRRARSGRHAQR